ncbi:hypothetical protein EZS27_042909 [termite gut metagenome]|uniref:DUF4143 domain-containing protein n=1 Tax=termite gut metagenome TaxID=433724 RepID=A0A5J4PAK6_9ZZZZ
MGYIGNIEVDFVCEKEAERIYVQVALRSDTNNTIEREFGNLLKIQDNFPKIVISEDEFSGNTFEGIQYFPIRRFLLEFCSV